MATVDFSHRTKFSHCTDANTNHLLLLTKASWVNQSQVESWKSGGLTCKTNGHICFTSTRMTCHTQLHLQQSDQEQDKMHKNHIILANNWYYAITSDPTLPQIIKVGGPHHCLHGLHSPSLHVLRKWPVLERNEKQHVSELWQWFPLFSLKNISVLIHRKGFRSESTAVLLNI